MFKNKKLIKTNIHSSFNKFKKYLRKFQFQFNNFNFEKTNTYQVPWKYSICHKTAT